MVSVKRGDRDPALGNWRWLWIFCLSAGQNWSNRIDFVWLVQIELRNGTNQTAQEVSVCLCAITEPIKQQLNDWV